MAKCHQNRKKRERRRRRQAGQSERKRRRLDIEEELRNGWLCNCGNWIDDGLHCGICQAEPPWGCPCSWCQGDRYESEEEYDDFDYYDADYSALDASDIYGPI